MAEKRSKQPTDLLESIQSPDDLTGLTYAELSRLAEEVRTFLVTQLAETGGHLSPNLGVVELTIAVHRVFHSPDDAIIWDTGHQAYVHKLITGRINAFDSLRQADGLSGYPRRAESNHDWIENSHASTSLSYAAGLAEGMARRGQDRHVVAIVGDGALTGGMAYEALNNIAHRRANILIILNDNGRSYAPTVGGLAEHLTQLRLDPRWERLKFNLAHRLRELPNLGEPMEEAARRIKESVKQLVAPTTFFETLGIKYSGPVDGHDLRALENTFALAKRLSGPVVVHVVTNKGNGYGPAMADEIDKLHGVGAFDPETGRPLRQEPTLTDRFGEALVELARARPEVVAVTAAMASSTGLLDFQREFPDRTYDVGIAEQHAVTFAAGLAMIGLRPVVCIYSTFLQRAFDQVLMDVCLHNLPVVFVLDRAGITGPDGPSHHGVFDLSYLRSMPGLAIGAPADGHELQAMLHTALDQDKGPIAIRYPKMSVDLGVRSPAPTIGLGQWIELVEGVDAAILAVGPLVEEALEASRILADRNLSIGVINARWVKPLDPKLDHWAAKFPLLLTAEDNVLAGGFGSAVLEHLSASGNAAGVRCAGLADSFAPQGSQAALRASFGLDARGLAERLMAELERSHLSPLRRSASQVDRSAG